MNLYFLSLIQFDREKRRKNLACVYDLGKDNPIGKQNIVTDARLKNVEKIIERYYLLGRFPLLKRGDYVRSPTNLWIWDGSCIKNIGECCFDTGQFHPSFFRLDIKPKMVLSLKERKKLALSKLNVIDPHHHCFVIPSFKIRKSRYKLMIFLVEITLYGDKLRAWKTLRHKIENCCIHDLLPRDGNILSLHFSS
jgi:hypothetical protein